MARATPQPVVDRLRRLCEVHSQETAAQIVHLYRNTVSKLKKRGWVARNGGPPKRPMPGDFPIQCNHMTQHELARHYRTGLCLIRRWLLQVERKYQPKREYLPIPTPEDLAETIARLGATKAAAHYSVHPNTLVRMRREAGLPIRKCRAKMRRAG